MKQEEHVVRTMTSGLGDWEGLFVDGKLVAEGHSIDVMAELARLYPSIKVGVEILDAYIEVDDDDEMENWYKHGGGGGCPKQWTKKLESLARRQARGRKK